jgi:hypothetical protein
MQKKEVLLVCDYSFMTMLWFDTLYDNSQLEEKESEMSCFNKHKSDVFDKLELDHFISSIVK